MKIVHFESGLGNQMLNYAEYLAICKNNKDVFAEKLIYETLPKGEGISQWNGYELESVFGLKIPDLSDLVGPSNYEYVRNKLVQSQYWKNEWKYAEPIVNSLNDLGYNVTNLCERGTKGDKEQYSLLGRILKTFCFKTAFGNFLYRLIARLIQNKLISKYSENLFLVSDGNFYCGQTLKFMYKNQGIELISSQLKKDFQFRAIDPKNLEYSKSLLSCESVSIHARRGDFLSRNSYCYKYGYFKRAVNLIRKKTGKCKLCFVFFCDENSVDWIKKKLKVFGLSESDSIEFVDWNYSDKSYIDLFLMSCCKHNIITQSSFGWWGSWLNRNPNKITISPDPRINTTDWI